VAIIFSSTETKKKVKKINEPLEHTARQLISSLPVSKFKKKTYQKARQKRAARTEINRKLLPLKKNRGGGTTGIEASDWKERETD